MSSPPQDPKISSSGYQMDAENIAEMARLTKQAQMLTDQFGLIPLQLDLPPVKAILDIGCGPGEWVLEMAQRFPAGLVTGIDISNLMINYARFSAEAQKCANVRFRVMDARQPLEFADASFDLVHARFITGFMSTTVWPLLIQECFRLLRPGGVFCTTEFEGLGITTSALLTHYNHLFVDAARRAGQCFTAEGDFYGITAVQYPLLQQAGFENIQQRAHSINYSIGMPAHEAMCDNFRTLMKLAQPFIVRSGIVTQEELDVSYVRIVKEMQADDFYGVAYFQTTWGYKPE